MWSDGCRLLRGLDSHGTAQIAAVGDGVFSHGAWGDATKRFEKAVAGKGDRGRMNSLEHGQETLSQLTPCIRRFYVRRIERHGIFGSSGLQAGGGPMVMTRG